MALRQLTQSTLVALALSAGLGTAVATEGPHVAPLTEFAEANVKPLILDPMVVEAIKSQNEKHANLTQDEIDTMDQAWRAETAATTRPIIDAMLAKPLSQHLRNWKDQQAGMVTEVTVMDNKGMSVGQSDVSTDLWQGDEAKYLETYPNGPGTVFVDEVEMDESTQSFQAEVSMSIVDPETGDVIGAIAVAVLADAL